MSDPKQPAEELADALDAWDGKMMMPKGWREQATDMLRSIPVLEDQRDAANGIASIMHTMLCEEVKRVKALEAENAKLHGWVLDAEQTAGKLQRKVDAAEAAWAAQSILGIYNKKGMHV